MKKTILAATAASLMAFSAQADTVIHITGSSAFRNATITAIQNVMGGAANVKSAYSSSSGSGVTSTNRAILQGSIASVPAAGVVTVKCSWSGSTGGIKTVVQNIAVATWPSITNLSAAVNGTPLAFTDATMSYALDTGTFPAETSLADVTMEDSSQAATGFTTVSLVEQQVGIIAFEWVAGNDSPSTLDNMTPLLAQAVLSGGAPLSQFTGNPADTKYVYVIGRNFDSGTRLSCLAETGVGVFGGVQHVQGTVSGTVGTAGSSITTLKLYPAETVLGQAFGIGQSGYSSGSFVSDLLATPGSSTAATPAGADQLLFGNGYTVGYIGRADAQRATKTSAIAGNTAHRMKWNGYSIANGPIGSNGVPASYNDNLITEGLYSLWEYQNLAYRSSYGTTSPNGKAVADAIANRILTVDGALSGTLISTMNVSKAVEGGVITHL